MDENLVINKKGFKFIRKFLKIFIFSFVGLIILLTIFTSIAYKEESVEGSGFIVPKEEVEIKAKISGGIRKTYVKDGDSVQAGDTLISFVNSENTIGLEKKKNDLRIQQSKLSKAAQELKVQTLEHKQKLKISQLDLKIAMTQLEEDTLLNKIDRGQNNHKSLIPATPYKTRLKMIAYEKAKISVDEFINDKEKLKLKEYELEIINREIEKLKRDIELLELNIRKSIITSPITGVIILSDKRKLIGSYFTEGQILMSIRDNSGWNVEARVKNKDIPFVKVELPVNVYVEAFPFMQYKIFKGRVTEIKTAPEVRGAMEQNRGTMYQVLIELNEPFVKKNEKIFELRKGLTVTIKIIIEKKKIIQSIWEMFLKVREK